MIDLLSSIKLKDKIVIISLMLIFAIVLIVGIGAVTVATTEVHKHNFEFHIERLGEDSFVVVGDCTDKTCLDPHHSWPIDSFSNVEVTEPTCSSAGNTRYILNTSVLEGVMKTYILDEPIPKLAHNYVGSVIVDGDGKASIEARCINESCASPKLSVKDVDVESSLKLVDARAATCYSSRYEKYEYTLNGFTEILESYIEEKVPHTLNGVYVTQYGPEGIFRYGVEGVTLKGVEALGCGQICDGSYVCEVCEKEQVVKVSRAPHEYKYDSTLTVLPTHLSPGSAILKCSAEDCGSTKTILLPKVAVGTNSEVIGQDVDKETQTVNYIYTYVEGSCKFVVDAEIDIPWKNHRFEYSESDVTRPTFTTNGSVILRCKNSVCSDFVIVTLPKMVEGHNTTTAFFHLLEKKTVTYSYTDSEYGFHLGFSYDEPWNDHSYVYSKDETVLPTLDANGEAYVRCYYEGCDKYHKITIPKIELGKDNVRVISDATEQAAAVARYTYENQEYGFTVTVDFNIGEPLTHNYQYRLVFDVFSGFSLVGVCNQPGCNAPEVRENNIQVTTEEHDVTCTTDGYIINRYEKDGVVYELTMPFGTAPGHKYDTEMPVSKTNPTWSKEGSVTIRCTNDGCEESVTLVLPKIEFGVTAFELDGGVDGQLYYMYYDEKTGYEHFFLV